MKTKIKLGIWMILIIGIILIPILASSQEATLTKTNEMIDTKTEESCIIHEDGTKECIWKQSSSTKYIENNGNYLSYNDFSTLTNNNNILSYSFIDGTEITLTPIIQENTNQTSLNNLPQEYLTQLNYQTNIEEKEDYSKFTVSLQKLKNINKLGFKIESNENIKYKDYSYIKEGVYENTPEEYNVTDLIINNVQLSFIDLIESNYNTQLDKENNILWISLEGKEGYLELDPVTSFFSESSDGYISCSELPFTCSGADSTSTTFSAGDNHVTESASQTYGELNFNTSSIPDDASITSVNLIVYVNAYQKRSTDNPEWVLTIQGKKNDYGTLDSSDWFLGNFDSFFNLSGTTGLKNISVNSSRINLTGMTHYQFDSQYWQHAPAGQQRTVSFRSAEYAGTTYDPYLEINYVLGGNNETERENAIEEGINNTILNGQDIYSNQQVYIVYPDGTQKLGTFDKVVSKDNQTWGFNYIISGETFNLMDSLFNTINLWENSSLEYNETISQVENFINSTIN